MRLADFDYELPAERIAQEPIEPRDAARLLVDRGQRRARAPPRPRPRPSCSRDGDLLVVNDTQGDPGPAAPARGERGSGRGAAARAARRRAAHVGGAGAPGPQAARAARCCSPATSALVEIGGAHRGRRHVRSHAPRRGRPARVARRARRDAAAAVHHRAARRPRAATRRCTPPSPARPPRRPPACTSRRAARRALAAQRRRHRAGSSCVVGLDTFQPVTVDDPRRPRDPQRALPRCRRTCSSACRGGAPGRRRRHHERPRPGERRRRPGSSSGRTRLFIHRPYDWQVVDLLMTNFHLPRTTLLMMIDAFVGDALAAPLRRGARRAATASSASATRCSSTAQPADARCTPSASRPSSTATARRAPASPRTARGTLPHAVLHAGRHPRRDQVPERRRLRAPRRRDRARQHVPPDAAARRRTSSPRFGGLGRFAGWDGLTLTDSRRLPGVLARRRRSTTTASRSAAPTTARRTASRRRRAVATCRSCSAPTSRWCSTCARRCRRRPTWCASPSSARPRGPARARAAHRRDDQALFGIVQGGIDEALRAESARAHGRRSTSTATASAG